MFLNSDNKKIVSYLESKELFKYKKVFLEFLYQDKKIDKKDLKILLKNMRSDFEEKVKENLLEIFSKNKISSRGVEKKSVKQRVKKFREKNKENGLKNISFFLSGEDYEKIKNMKREKNMTYSELISFLLNSQNNL